VNPSKLFLEVETPHRVVSPDDMARNNMSLDGNIPHLYQLAAMCMRFVLDCTSTRCSQLVSDSIHIAQALNFMSVASSSRPGVFVNCSIPAEVYC
jgi:hypothetical protein